MVMLIPEILHVNWLKLGSSVVHKNMEYDNGQAVRCSTVAARMKGSIGPVKQKISA